MLKATEMQKCVSRLMMSAVHKLAVSMLSTAALNTQH